MEALAIEVEIGPQLGFAEGFVLWIRRHIAS